MAGQGPPRPHAPESLLDTLLSEAGGPGGVEQASADLLPFYRFLLPFTQLSETLANFLPPKSPWKPKERKALENRTSRPGR